MLRLHVLGGASLEDENGVLSGPASQRHRLALLALLAVHSRGLSRDKLMAYLWPERDAEHARKLLNQAVHALRRAIGEEAILSAGDELRPNPLVIAADVVEFEAACLAGDAEAAVAAYRGPLLDGFFLSASTEFEQWVEQERGRLGGLHAKALEELAERAESEGDRRGALEWWRRRAAQDPYDSRVALHLVHALDADGNRAAALQQAGIHERLLKEEFGVEPPPELTALVERLRAEPARGPGGEPKQGQLAMSGPPVRDVASPAASSVAPEGGRPQARAARRSGLTRYAVAVLVLVGVAYASTRLVRSESATSSIAVLPLASFGGDPSEIRLAAAMTEEITSILAKASGLRVIGSTSARALSGRERDARVIADSLGVDYVVEGAVQTDSMHLRVTVRLVAAQDGSTVWSETYNRDLHDVFAVQEVVARAVARELGHRLAGTDVPPRREPTRNVAAYDLFLRGNDPVLLRSDSSARRALEYFRQAIVLDSGYAAAWAGLARLYNRTSRVSSVEQWKESVRLAEAAALKALSLDDALAEAHATLATLRMSTYDLDAAERGLRRAIELDPAQARLREWLTNLHIWRERPGAALAEARRAQAIDPLSPTANAAVAHALLANDRCDEALPILEELAMMKPPLQRAAPIAAQCYARLGRWPEAIAAVQAQAHVETGLLGYLLARAGNRAEAQRVLDSLLEQAGNGRRVAFSIALLHAGLGDLDQCFAWLDRSIEDGSMLFPGEAMLMAPLLREELQGEPRYKRLRVRLGL